MQATHDASAGRGWTTLLAAAALGGAAVCWAQWMRPTYNADFSAYWSAGRAALQGRHPYRDAPRLSDGRPFPHADFLYPPSSLTFFSPLALVPYHEARSVWLALEVTMLAAALWLGGLSLRLALAAAAALLAIAPVLFYPLYAHLERGQADLFTLFWIALAWRLWHRERPLAAGVAIAAAAVVKPPALLLLAVPLLERQWRVAAGTAAGIAFLSLCSLAFVSTDLHREYWTVLFPALSRKGTLPFDNPHKASLRVTTDIEGHSYGRGRSFQAAAASFRNDGRASVVGAALVVLLMYWRGRGQAPPNDLRRWRWITAMVSILVLHPKTWLMSYVWLVLPAVLLWTVEPKRLGVSTRSAVAAMAVLLIGMGDGVVEHALGAFEPTTPPRVLRFMFVYGRAIFGGILLLIVCLSRADVRLEPVTDRT